MRQTLFLPIALSLVGTLAPVLVGCGPSASECDALESSWSEVEPAAMQGFASEAALASYLADAEARSAERDEKLRACRGSDKVAYESGSVASPSAAGPAGEPANANVTNNQEAGADEGGIVKNVGSHLVVLRKGRLFAVDVAAAPTVTHSIRVAPNEMLNSGVWYDEMLVKGDLVYVVGYRYSLAAAGQVEGTSSPRGATEISSFRLTSGRLTRIGSTFLESNDYYSGSNYASRMVDGELVFYMPHYVGRKDAALSFPRVLELDRAGGLRAVGPIFGVLDVTRSHERPYLPTFHTVVKCALPDTGALDCHGKSVLGSWGREHYVSAGAVYLFTDGHTYRFALSNLDVTVHGAEGHPRDQFSFKETSDALFVAVDGRAGPALTKLPLAAFDKRGAQGVASTPLGLDYVRENRFVGQKLVAAGGSSRVAADQRVVTVDLATLAVQQIARPNVIRIEPLDGERALVVSVKPESGSLVLGAYSTTSLSAPPGEVALDGLTQGESRSHGFFFRPSAAGGGTFGYAVLNAAGARGSSLFGGGISNLGFFTVAPERAIAKVGVVSSGDVASECETSCIDWYGNTRPIFLGDRVFALMGSELTEVSLAGGASRVGQAAVLRSEDSPSP